MHLVVSGWQSKKTLVIVWNTERLMSLRHHTRVRVKFDEALLSQVEELCQCQELQMYRRLRYITIIDRRMKNLSEEASRSTKGNCH